MQPLKPPTFLDVFSGCGGLSLGLFAAGWQGLFAIEKNRDAFSTLKHNLISPDVPRYKFEWPNWLAQEATEAANLLANHCDELSSLAGKVDLIAGGPPCQGFSTAGKRNPDDPRNLLTEDYIRIVSLVQPRLLLIENVRGFNAPFKDGKRSRKDLRPYSEFVREKLERLGYQVHQAVICCSDFGVPQYRKRFLMIAVRHGDSVCAVLGGSNPIELLLEKALEFRLGKGLRSGINISTKAALSDLETSRHDLIPHGGPQPGFNQIKYVEPGKLSEYQELMRAGMNGLAPNSLRLARHSDVIRERFKEIQEVAAHGRCLTPCDRLTLGIKKHSITPLHQHMPSATVTTLPDDILHYSEPRILTVRENARLQSFPDWFEFQGKYTTGGKNRKFDCPRYTQVGNAVPPLLAEAIGSLLLELITDVSSRTVKNKPNDVVANVSIPPPQCHCVPNQCSSNTELATPEQL